MIGAVVIVVVLVVILPVLTLIGGAAIAAALGSSLRSHAERTHEGSEMIDLNT